MKAVIQGKISLPALDIFMHSYLKKKKKQNNGKNSAYVHTVLMFLIGQKGNENHRNVVLKVLKSRHQ